LGTGSGAIALALASERPSWTLVAVDSQPTAVALAISNRDRLGLCNVEILQSDWFATVSGHFDLIVSNPPYIDPADPHLQQGDVRHEPHSALVAQAGGLADLAHIIALAVDYLTPQGVLIVEHGADQGEAVRSFFAAGSYETANTLRDLSGLERVTLSHKAP
ncbi:MAG: peptide chain release factor N(5)-glutamine methyltransferase, partial [Tissierellales bacterium]